MADLPDISDLVAELIVSEKRIKDAEDTIRTAHEDIKDLRCRIVEMYKKAGIGPDDCDHPVVTYIGMGEDECACCGLPRPYSKGDDDETR